MGQVIRLSDYRDRRRALVAGVGAPSAAEFFFDLACPFTYLAAERVERSFDEVTWTPASATALRCGVLRADAPALRTMRREAEQRAEALRLPLEWPERWPADVPAAMRVAHHAAQVGRGGAFVLAAARLAFAGGFDLGDPEILTEAAAASGLGLDESLRAAGERRRDGAVEAAARRLMAAGAYRLPALRAGDALFAGEDRVAEAAAAARLHGAVVER